MRAGIREAYTKRPPLSAIASLNRISPIVTSVMGRFRRAMLATFAATGEAQSRGRLNVYCLRER